ncbi:hypothetical protein EV361DRAFT_167383 [Lentinula raphanica]|nr:hypothetical protein EV361DRAFT_167383 [Lentinula raphanica]
MCISLGLVGILAARTMPIVHVKNERANTVPLCTVTTVTVTSSLSCRLTSVMSRIQKTMFYTMFQGSFTSVCKPIAPETTFSSSFDRSLNVSATTCANGTSGSS